MSTKRPPVRTEVYPFHDGSERSRTEALVEHCGYFRPRLRGLAIAFGFSCLFWLLAVVLPVWWAVEHGRIG